MKTIKKLAFHPAAKHFPLMVECRGGHLLNTEENETWRRFVQDIRINGQHEPITLVDGKILDGRNRYLACRFLGVEVEYTEAVCDSADVLSLSLNLHRRHLTAGQVASIVCEQILPEERKAAAKRQSAAGGDTTAPRSPALTAKATEAAAKKGGTSARSVEQYEALSDEAKAEVKAGTKSVSGAYSAQKKVERDAAEKKDGVALATRLGLDLAAKLEAAATSAAAVGKSGRAIKYLPDHVSEEIVTAYAKLRGEVVGLPFKTEEK